MEFRLLESKYPDFNFVFANRTQLQIEDENAVNHFFADHIFFACINCAAYTAVDKAESEQEEAMKINALAVGTLAAACKSSRSHFIHFSTDYVFNGEGSNPYKETDATDPVNLYGKTKLQGEHAALANNPEALIIRTSWVYSRYGNNFVKTMLRLMSEKESIGVVADQYGSPTYAADLADAVMQILGKSNFIPGIYHYCNEGIISWHQFAEAIKEIGKFSCLVNAIPTSAYPTPAKRPRYSALDTQKIRNNFEIDIPHWKESLDKRLSVMK